VRAELDTGRTLMAVARTFGVSVSTVSRIATEDAPPRPRGGAIHVKLTAAESLFLAERLTEDPRLTGGQLAAELAERGVDVAASTVNAHVRSPVMEQYGVPRFTVKRLRVQEEARNSDAVKEQRREYIIEYNRLLSGGSIVVFVDETPFDILDTRHMARAPIGQRAVVRRRQVRTTGVTAITAISDVWGVVHVEFVLGCVTADAFRVFLGDLFETIRGHTREAVLLVMDNVAFHRTAGVRAMIEASGHRVLYTAPWSCELNPIEYVFGFVKTRVRVPSEVSNTRAVLSYLVEAFRSATRAENCQHDPVRDERPVPACLESPGAPAGWGTQGARGRSEGASRRWRGERDGGRGSCRR